MTYRDAADLMGNAFNLFAASAFLFAAAFHFSSPAHTRLGCLEPLQAIKVVRGASGSVAGRVVAGVAQCALHPRCVAHGAHIHMGGGLEGEERLEQWLQAGFGFTTRLAHQAAFCHKSGVCEGHGGGRAPLVGLGGVAGIENSIHAGDGVQ